MNKTTIYFALNRDNQTVCALPGFDDWEQVQGAFRCGIVMPDGKQANGIGRTKSIKELNARAERTGYRVLVESTPVPHKCT